MVAYRGELLLKSGVNAAVVVRKGLNVEAGLLKAYDGQRLSA